MLLNIKLHKTHCLMAALSAMLLLQVASAMGAADATVAEVSDLKGTVMIMRGPAAIAVEKGTRLKNEDILETGPEGSVGIVFNDETTLSLGPDSHLTIQEYVFEPEQSSFSFVVRLIKGTASYVSGLIAKLSPDSTRFITPSASIGVRGTKFVIQVDGV